MWCGGLSLMTVWDKLIHSNQTKNNRYYILYHSLNKTDNSDTEFITNVAKKVKQTFIFSSSTIVAKKVKQTFIFSSSL